MPTRLPQVVTSRDGRRAIRVETIERDPFGRGRFDGFYLDGAVFLSPGSDPSPVQFKVSGSFRSMWDAKGQTLRWNEPFDSAVTDLALIALGQFLDDNDVPGEPVDGDYAATVNVLSDLFEIFKQPRATEGELATYAQGKIYWAWKFGNEPSSFETWEGYRFRVSVTDLDRAAFANVGVLWQKDKAGYRAMPALARQWAPSRVVSASESQYDVALSFAGEQRSFVQDVAAALKESGARVFYDDFVDLWGKDLTIELERVFRNGSRFVVIFVSREYVEKAWPNLERQHALAGRIERMDDSVLPARFDPISLPGLPTTVSYLDIRDRSPADLASLILQKLG